MSSLLTRAHRLMLNMIFFSRQHKKVKIPYKKLQVQAVQLLLCVLAFFCGESQLKFAVTSVLQSKKSIKAVTNQLSSKKNPRNPTRRCLPPLSLIKLLLLLLMRPRQLPLPAQPRLPLLLPFPPQLPLSPLLRRALLPLVHPARLSMSASWIPP